MQKIQVLFPDPVMERLRAVALAQDRSVSELVRRAVDRMLEQCPVLPPSKPARFPTFHGGDMLAAPDRLREVLHEPDDDDTPAGERDGAGGSSR
jgi:hypothetical protein